MGPATTTAELGLAVTAERLVDEDGRLSPLAATDGEFDAISADWSEPTSRDTGGTAGDLSAHELGDCLLEGLMTITLACGAFVFVAGPGGGEGSAAAQLLCFRGMISACDCWTCVVSGPGIP